MDIRNIKELPQDINSNNDILSSIFTVGKHQLNMYLSIGIEPLPEYPIDVNNPVNQQLLKDFISRVIEELCEGYQSTEELYQICNYSLGWNMDKVTDEQADLIQGHLQNANEEQADALGFFMSLLLFANIDTEDIYKWAKHRYYIKINNLSDIMIAGVSLLEEYETVNNFSIGNCSEITPGFYRMSPTSHFKEQVFLFSIISSLNLARNSLKCRPWKQTQVMTKEIEFQDYLVEAFYKFMGFLHIYEFTPKSLYTLYFKKYKLNEWRISTSY